MINFEFFFQKIIKKKIFLLFVHSKRYIGLNFEKINNVFEIHKILELQTDKLYSKVKNIFFKKKIASKKKVFIKR